MQIIIQWLASFYVEIITIFIATILIVCSLKRISYLKKENQKQRKLLEAQKEYYLKCLEREEETKRFRHDIRGHMCSMTSMINNKMYAELESYLNDIHAEFQQLHMKCKTGNESINAIVCDIMGKYENVDVNWKGMLADELEIRQIDLCTIFYNLLNNAFRAVNNTEYPRVYVEIKYLEKVLVIKVKNHVENNVDIVDGRYVKGKRREGHGYGLENVRRCVDSYGGMLRMKSEDNKFYTEIILPNVCAA